MTDKTLPPLLPCPFCGHKTAPRIFKTSEDWDEENEGPYPHSEGYAVVCDARSPGGPGGCGAASGFGADDEAQAVEKWNARAALAVAQPEAVDPDGRLHDDGYFTWNTKKHKPYERPTALPCDFYLAAQPEQAQQPLTVNAIKAIWSEHPELSDPGRVLVAFARAIERAHGIGAKEASR